MAYYGREGAKSNLNLHEYHCLLKEVLCKFRFFIDPKFLYAGYFCSVFKGVTVFAGIALVDVSQCIVMRVI